MPPDEINDLIKIHTRRLQELKKRQATYGLSVDPSITLEIQDIEAKLQELQAQPQTQGEVKPGEPPSAAVPAGAVPAGKSVLVVEDEAIWQDILQECLIELGCVVEVAATFAEARRKLQTGQFNLVTIDAYLSPNVQSSEGMLLLDSIRNRFGPDFPIIMVSGAINKRDLVRAFQKFSVENVLLKDDFEYDEFRTAVQEALSA